MRREWEDEPDFQDGKTDYGYPLVIRRGTMGALCGYVGVPPENPLAGLEEDDERVMDLDVHGGITFAHATITIRDHVVPTGYWWFGFDCAHAGDTIPDMPEMGLECNYRNIQYVREQTVRLADQLRAIQDAE